MPSVHDFKIVVAGPFASGKTTLINAISDTPVVGTEQPTSGAESAVKEFTTVGMEHGHYSVGDDETRVNLFLFGVPGQSRFSFMWDIVGEGLDGLVVLVDGTAPHTWTDAGLVGEHFTDRWNVPVVVAANRTDDPAVLAHVRESVAVPNASYVTCDVRDEASAADVLIEVLSRVLEAMETPHLAS